MKSHLDSDDIQSGSAELTIVDFGDSTISYKEALHSVTGSITQEDIEGFLSVAPMPQKDS